MRSTILAILVVVVACASERQVPAAPAPVAPVPPVAEATATPDDEVIFYGDVSSAAADVPARFAAPLPRSAQEASALWRSVDAPFPPEAHVVTGICRGDREMFGRLEASLAGAADAAALVEHWDGPLSRCRGDRYCAAARPYLAGPPGVMRDVLASGFASACATLSDAPLLLREDTPALAVLAFHRSVQPPFSPRIAAAIRALPPAERNLASHDVYLLGRSEEPAALRALWDLHRDLGASELGGAIAYALAMRGGPRGLEAARAACATLQGQAAMFCTGIEKAAAKGPPTPAPERTESAETRALVERLRAAGLVGEVPPVKTRPGAPPLDAADVLLAADRGVREQWTGGLTPGHDLLLAQLTDLIPDLSGAVFEEQAQDHRALATPYRVRAYLGGVRYQTIARGLGRQDIDAVVGLLNSILRARGSATRVIALTRSGPVDEIDQMNFGGHPAAVVVGPRDALARAVRDGLLLPRPPAPGAR